MRSQKKLRRRLQKKPQKRLQKKPQKRLQKETPEETPEETPAATSVETVDETAELVVVVPGGTILVTNAPQVYDFSALRNESAPSTAGESPPIIELRAYGDDDPESGELVNTVSLGGSDTRVKLDASDFNGIYGTYYPYDGEAVIDKPFIIEGPSDASEPVNATEKYSSGVEAENMTTAGSIIVSNETARETGPPTTTGTDEMTTETMETSTADMPTFTPIMAAEVNPDQTQAAPLSLLGAVVGLLAAAGLFLVMRRK